MAKQYSTAWTDDLDGSVAATTLEFSFDGVRYAIDLSEANAVRMRNCFEPYIRAASRASRGSDRTNWPVEQASSGKERSHHRQAREWLRMNGHEVGSRGRLPQELLQRYEAARGGSERCLLGG
ncbi:MULTISPECIES: Lsr2 family protein [unclassified Mycobacterium]|uniref:histone-like nucleoid-structuring protein Lsr2 n=1 Tax=unclassified Mycobacterium TaxID=2642494 RepID=UPI00048E559B|nr:MULTISPECIES: Lsr2 family protein [unclassified Mycobacterium]SEB26065.1 Lsr2 protein [Mycobacterium sp. 283mftsu]